MGAPVGGSLLRPGQTRKVTGPDGAGPSRVPARRQVFFFADVFLVDFLGDPLEPVLALEEPRDDFLADRPVRPDRAGAFAPLDERPRARSASLSPAAATLAPARLATSGARSATFLATAGAISATLSATLRTAFGAREATFRATFGALSATFLATAGAVSATFLATTGALEAAADSA